MAKANQKAKAEEDPDTHIIHLESTVKDLDTIVWARDSGNYYIDNAKLFEAGVGATIVIEDQTFEVRMPNRLLVKNFKQLQKRVNRKKKTLKVTTDEAFTLEDQMEELMIDMIIGLDLSDRDLRLDDFQYNQISEFCWEFYNFFVSQSRVAIAERRSSLKDA